MEGQAPAPTPAPAPKKSMLPIVAAVIVVIIVIAVIAAVLLMNPSGGGNGGGGDNTGASWNPQEGQYLDYSMSMAGSVIMTEHLLVKSVTATTVTLNISATAFGHTSYSENTYNKSEAVGSTFDINNPPTGYTITNEGKSSVSTGWGLRSCDHYHVTYNSEGVSGTLDMYIYKNILVKMDGTTEGQSISMTLTGTNVSVITSG